MNDTDPKVKHTPERILAMSHLEMARLWRNAPVGHPYFTDPELYSVFEARFKELGGMSPEVSKQVGWS